MEKMRKIKRYTLMALWDDGEEEDITSEVYLHDIEDQLDKLEEDRHKEIA